MGRQRELKDRASSEIDTPIYGVSDSPEQQRLQQQAQAAQGQSQQAYGQQQDVYNQLLAQAQGTAGPSMAQMQAQQAQQQNMVNQMGQAAAGRGGNLAAQARQAQGMGAAAQMASNQQMQQISMAEQQQAQAMLQQQANVMGGQAQQGMLGMEGLTQQTNMGIGQQQLDANIANQQAAAQQMQANRQNAMDIVNVGAGMAQSAAMLASDEGIKDISSRDAGGKALEAVRGLESLEYEYKDGYKQLDGTVLGISAQQVEKVAPSLVDDSPGFKAVSVPGGLSLALAATAALAREVEEMKRGNSTVP